MSAATIVLLGLHFIDQFARGLFEDEFRMEESSTYRAIIHRGKVEGARRILLLQGEAKFGASDDTARAVIESMSDLDQLVALAMRLMNAESWQELLAGHRPKRGRRSRT